MGFFCSIMKSVSSHQWLALVLLAGFIGLSSCKKNYSQTDLLGTWKTDSVYAYYNGFSYWQHHEGNDWASLKFKSDGTFEESKFNSPQRFHYALKEDSIHWESKNTGQRGVFSIEKLKKNTLVLKKIKPSMFGDPADRRFEVRYFTKTD